MSDLSAYRNSAAEQARVADLMRLVPSGARSILDIGARDGYVSKRLADRGMSVIALDLEYPTIDDPRIRCMQGDVTALRLGDRSVDCILCAEVLEHVPTTSLATACAELGRVARAALLIGVPYRQDLRLGRTTCAACHRPNPPWGHVNAFDERRLLALFAGWLPAAWSYIGRTRERTNAVSSALMSYARNPYGTYAQEERCIHCDAPIARPREGNLLQRTATRVASRLTRGQQRLMPGKAKWVHVRFERG